MMGVFCFCASRGMKAPSLVLKPTSEPQIFSGRFGQITCGNYGVVLFRAGRKVERIGAWTGSPYTIGDHGHFGDLPGGFRCWAFSSRDALKDVLNVLSPFL